MFKIINNASLSCKVVSTFSCSLHLKISSATHVSCFKNLVVLRKCLKTFFGGSIDAAQSLKSKFKLFTKFLFVFLFRQKKFVVAKIYSAEIFY